ncbi:ATP-dependent helicase HrpB [Vibrio sp. S4M6]|uniref:ATP-dependent helicase HrpB n=1 Tax=Vibrio sinus TaxID=2946865 RepID=UPI00202ABA71|nr:ATP-dependent helicase HrpB [Vibrio sinus]
MPEIMAAIAKSNQVILSAEPGAGKSTLFPLTLLKQGKVEGKIIMLEPRRLAARAIAHYLSAQLDEQVGGTIGYRVRGENRTGPATKLEIVTEGVLTRMLQSDPTLDEVGMLIFDEYHERSIHADTALALSLDIQQALRDDLKIVVMSATLDDIAMQTLLPDAQYVCSKGRSFPIELQYRPLKPNENLASLLTQQIHRVLGEESGSILVFLPGIGLIQSLFERLTDLPDDVQVRPLYGQLSLNEQQKAIAPCQQGQRKVVLATNIAETSLTIEGIRVVIDSGLERVAKFDLNTGVTKLEQANIAQSSAKQRAGRAGRTEPGVCVRLYSESQLQQQPIVPVAEILRSDLSNLAMELAQWGIADALSLTWLDAPPVSALKQAKQLLSSLGLIEDNGQLSTFGKQAYSLGVEPRLAAMLTKAKSTSDALFNTALVAAAIVEEPPKRITDVSHVLHRVLSSSDQYYTKQIQARAKQLASRFGYPFRLEQVEEKQLAMALALAFPDRIAQKRAGRLGQFVLANGHGATISDEEPLAQHNYLVVVDLMRISSHASQIFFAASLDVEQLTRTFPEFVKKSEALEWDESKGKLSAEERYSIGKLVLQRKVLTNLSDGQMRSALLNYVREQGLSVLNWSGGDEGLLQRIRCAIDWLPEQQWPAMQDVDLLDELDIWLEPYMTNVTSLQQLQSLSLEQPLLARLGWPLNQQINEWLPETYTLPTGSVKKIRYQQGSEPILSVRMQEVFGEKQSPNIALGRKSIVLELLSPAQRPLQVTQDLAGFWQGAYKEVQKEMKGRYPKHVWPDDPAEHIATKKTKRQLK